MVAGIMFLDLKGMGDRRAKEEENVRNFCTLSTSRYTDIFGAPAMEQVCSGKPKDQSQFYGHETYAIVQGYMLRRSYAWFNVLLMLS